MRHLIWAFGWVTCCALGACSSDKDPDRRVKVTEDTEPGFRVDDSNLNDVGARTSADTPQCQTEARAAEAIGLDMYVMLDASGSMSEPVLNNRFIIPISKWDAVRTSLTAFVEAPDTQGIGVGLQFFPQIEEGEAPACNTSSDCGAAGGPCSNSKCVQFDTVNLVNGPPGQFIAAVDSSAFVCENDAECGAGLGCRSIRGLCVLPPGALAQIPAGDPLPLGVPAFCGTNKDCADLPRTVCQPLGACSQPANGQDTPCTPSFDCPAGAGPCVQPSFACLDQTRCDVQAYATPAVPITSDSSRSDAIRQALAARTPLGLTPTAPALRGALQEAALWAEQHPERQVVTVLATDGLPKGRCTPTDIPGIVAIAQAANMGARPSRTFVIGVFAADDLAQGRREDLDAIARAGGTGQAIVISTAGDVTQDFLNALNRIRDTSVSCEFQLNDAGLDFDKVNLEVVDGAGATPLVNVGDSVACGTDEQGWFYERDAAGTPTQISVCPSTCDRFTKGGVTANLQIGCATRIR